MTNRFPLLALFLTALPPLAGQATVNLTLGYDRAGNYDEIYSPLVYAGNGADIRLGMKAGGGALRHRVETAFPLFDLFPSGNAVYGNFDVLSHGAPANVDILSSYYRADGLSFSLSYAAEFRADHGNAPLRAFIGPELSVRGSMIGIETYYLAATLGASLGLEFFPAEGQGLSIGLSLPLAGLVNRPAWTLFDNRIMINWENNLAAEFVHFDRLASPFLGDFFGIEARVAFDWNVAGLLRLGLEYSGRFVFCAFPERMLVLEQGMGLRAALSWL